jgi:hypothetical protein
MGRPYFIRSMRFRAFRHLPSPGRPLGLVSQLELRPARFLLGLGEKVRWEQLDKARSAPVNVAFYLGRVEEVAEDEIVATVWERPSGREAATVLSMAKHLPGQRPPPPGSLLRIWTWIELPGGGQQVPGLKVEVERPHLDEQQRAELRKFLDSLKAQAPETDEDET